MKKHFLILLSISSILISLSSCVSTLLQEKAPSFSKEITFTEPQNTNASFKKIQKSIYPAWKNQVSGNVISIISDCNETTPLSFSNMQQLFNDSIDQAKITKQIQIQFKNKLAHFMITSGQIDGQDIEIRSLTFKRKNCVYLSALSGKPIVIEQDQKSFDNFNQNLIFK
jgi:hypothetical protein